MIQRKKEMQVTLREQMRGGKGTVKIRELFAPGTYQGQARLIAEITLQPGVSIGMHEHENEEEIYYVIAGEGVLTTGTPPQEIVLGEGDASLTLGGESHAIRNDSVRVLRIMAIILLY